MIEPLLAVVAAAAYEAKDKAAFVLLPLSSAGVVLTGLMTNVYSSSSTTRMVETQ